MISSLTNDAVHALLSPENNIVYRVPKYQREYSWGRDQWDDLFDDLLDYSATEGHFLGTIICVNSTQNTTHESILEVIDGQQRLTTISLLLAAVYSVLSDPSAVLDEDAQNDKFNLRKMLTLKNPMRSRLRPQTQNQNAEDYDAVLAQAGLGLDAKTPRNAGNRRITLTYKRFKSRISDRAEETQQDQVHVALDLLARIKQANIVKLEVNSHADAFTLFESLNNRGMPLTPIDLIKNTLLGRADQQGQGNLDETYDAWRRWLSILGDDYATQERFFRYFYNAMREEYDLTVQGIQEATRTNLIRIYETLIDRDLPHLQNVISQGVEAFGKLTGNRDAEVPSILVRAFRRLRRAQGAPAQILLLYLLLKQEELNISDTEVADITDLLTAFFVRRNLTGTPATYVVTRGFINLVPQLRENEVGDRKQTILEMLKRLSVSDEGFKDVLSGPVYDLNADVVRFILVTLAERAMTDENEQDLWYREISGNKSRYRWSIEHILPQGENLRQEWVEMLGGTEAAQEARRNYAHYLGNLTITGYNSTLSNRAFVQKRDHKDANGNWIGYRNGLNLNADLATRDDWNVEAILERTKDLVALTLQAFPLEYKK